MMNDDGGHMDDTKKSLTRTYRFDPITVRILGKQAALAHCKQSEFIRRMIRASEKPTVFAAVFTGEDHQESAA
jgi:hypothetical protein